MRGALVGLVLLAGTRAAWSPACPARAVVAHPFSCRAPLPRLQFDLEDDDDFLDDLEAEARAPPPPCPPPSVTATSPFPAARRGGVRPSCSAPEIPAPRQPGRRRAGARRRGGLAAAQRARRGGAGGALRGWGRRRDRRADIAVAARCGAACGAAAPARADLRQIPRLARARTHVLIRTARAHCLSARTLGVDRTRVHARARSCCSYRRSRSLSASGSPARSAPSSAPRLSGSLSSASARCW